MGDNLQQTLLGLFQQVSEHPDSLPSIVVDAYSEGSTEWQLLSSYRTMLERLQQSKKDAQRSVEAQLSEKESQYHNIFEATTDGMLITTIEGNVVEANPAMCSMLGYTYEEMLSLHYVQFTSPELHPFILKYMRKVQKGNQLQTQSIGMRKDGSYFFVEVDGKPFLYKGKIHILSAVRDITARKQAEEQLREKEEQYRSIFEATTNGLFITDPEDGHLVEVNPAAHLMHGYTYDEFIKLHPMDFIHPNSHPIFAEYIQTVRAGGQFHAQAVDVHKDGTQFPVEVYGTQFMYKGRAHVLGIVRDITELVQSYQLLEQRVEERTQELSTLLEVSHNVASTIELNPLLELILDQLQALVHYSGASILLVDGEDLVIVHYRGIWTYPDERLLYRRYSLKAAIQVGLPLKAFVLDDAMDDTPVSQHFRKINFDLPEIDTGAIRSWMHVPLILKEKLIGFFQLSSSEPHYYTSRHVTVTQAIANQAAVAIENARFYEQAQELAAFEERQRLARELHDSVSQALYGITLGTHTARTLLDRDPSKVAEPLNYVLSLSEAALAEMRALIFELRPESLETDGLVAALTKQGTALQARHNIAISLNLCEEPALSLKVKQELYRVAQEALHNIVKHASATKAEVLLAYDADGITLKISDNGRGFDPGESFPGHLGLRSMRERISKLRGRFHIESQTGCGTVIWAWTPI